MEECTWRNTPEGISEWITAAISGEILAGIIKSNNNTKISGGKLAGFSRWIPEIILREFQYSLRIFLKKLLKNFLKRKKALI